MTQATTLPAPAQGAAPGRGV
ncbi:MAG: hypothetical protein QOH87_2644, partial [Trebonia sp.]|nr:hypothetical protein [Trebonia sp.]